MKPVRVLIVDHHPVVRMGVRHLLSAETGFTIVGEAGDCKTALELAASLRPGIVLLDLDIPDGDSIELAHSLRNSVSRIAILVLTMNKSEEAFNRALNAGSKGYLLKDSPLTEIMAGLRAVAAGDCYISPRVSSFVVRRQENERRAVNRPPGLASLTPTELRILKLIARNQTTKQIAAELSISRLTVETHRRNMCEKLNLHGSHPLLSFALLNQSDL